MYECHESFDNNGDYLTYTYHVFASFHGGMWGYLGDYVFRRAASLTSTEWKTQPEHVRDHVELNFITGVLILTFDLILQSRRLFTQKVADLEWGLVVRVAIKLRRLNGTEPDAQTVKDIAADTSADNVSKYADVTAQESWKHLTMGWR